MKIYMMSACGRLWWNESRRRLRKHRNRLGLDPRRVSIEPVGEEKYRRMLELRYRDKPDILKDR